MTRAPTRYICAATVTLPLIMGAVLAASAPRARDLGVPFDGTPGPLNAITDVPGVEVGHATLIRDEGADAVRTGVTVVFPEGKAWSQAFAGCFVENGSGELTGCAWVTESGILGGPIAITNTWSVGTVHDAMLTWYSEARHENIAWHLPVVGETSDAYLNDIAGMHVKKDDVWAALNGGRSGPVAEGNVGGGTGNVAHGLKGGIGTSSRLVAGGYTVGVLVQANYGIRELLTIAGVPVGKEISDPRITGGPASADRDDGGREGSIIVIVATDAPLLPHQLQRLARRVPLGIARVGGTAANGSGDLFIGFSTANPALAKLSGGPVQISMLPNGDMNSLFLATIESTEEAIVNALVAATTMTGVNGHTVYALPHEQLREILRKYGRLHD
ncbi:MAG TPA: P1 family peptidase [Steroidobacteraceae bacterium]|jgi:L-aminopeptidase/D-esterase-like protein|nr:P1 family peptidase [Steroidobacteraceae bacterium]